MMLRKLCLALVCAASFTACGGTAQLVTQNQTGGVFRLMGVRDKAMADAHNQMAAHCGPGNYTVVQQGEEVIGTDVITRSDTSYGEDTAAGGASSTTYGGSGSSTTAVGGSSTRGGSTTEGVQSTRNATEWRIHYVCGAPGTAAGGPPPPPPPPPAY